MDLLVRPVGLIVPHQGVLVILPFAILMSVMVVVVVATATSAVLLSLPHGTLFSRAVCLANVEVEVRDRTWHQAGLHRRGAFKRRPATILVRPLKQRTAVQAHANRHIDRVPSTCVRERGAAVDVKFPDRRLRHDVASRTGHNLQRFEDGQSALRR